MNVSNPTGPRPQIEVAVVMRREPVTGPMSRWQQWRWALADVVPVADQPPLPPDAVPAQPLMLDRVEGMPESVSHWLYPGYRVELFRDDAEGFFLNLTSPQPCFWVMWRQDDNCLIDGEPSPVPQAVTLSYHDAGRFLEAEEQVEQVPAPGPVIDWLRGFVAEHYQPEPKKRKRPESFRPLADRFGNPVSITTEKRRGGMGDSHGG